MYQNSYQLNLKSITKLLFNTGKINLLISLLSLVIVSFSPIIELSSLNGIIEFLQNENKDINSLFYYIAMYLMFGMFIPTVFSSVYYIFMTKVKMLLDIEISKNALKKSIDISVTNIESGEGVNNVWRASQTRGGGVADLLFQIIEFVFNVIKCFSIILVIKNIGISIICVLITLLLSYKIKKNAIKDFLEKKWIIDEEERYCNYIFDFLQNRKNIVELKHYKSIDYVFEKYVHLTCKKNKARNQLYRCNEERMMFADSIQYIAFFIMVMIVMFKMDHNVISQGVGVTIIYAIMKLLNICSELINAISKIEEQKIIINEYNKLMRKENECKDYECKDYENVNFNGSYAIKLKNVSYCYPNYEKKVLNNINLDIRAGETIVLVGENGSGKSSLFRLLLGYDMDFEGNISYNGVNIKECIGKIRKSTTIMLQDFFKYNMTIKENISVSRNGDINDDEYDEAKKWAEIDELILKQKDKDYTEMINATGLSGGEWQKIALARMKIRNGNILFLDEPNSAIDPFYELKLYQKIINVSKGKTTIIVSHRLPICQMADRILVMKEGKIIEDGSHRELIDKEDGVYKKLFLEQAGLYAGQ